LAQLWLEITAGWIGAALGLGGLLLGGDDLELDEVQRLPLRERAHVVGVEDHAPLDQAGEHVLAEVAQPAGVAVRPSGYTGAP
jgi:hypothetical protein